MDCNSSADAQFSPMTCGPVAMGAEGLRPACFYSSHFLSPGMVRVSVPRETDRQGISQLISLCSSTPSQEATIFFFCLFVSPYPRAELMDFRNASQSSTVMSGEQASDGLGGGNAVEKMSETKPWRRI